VGWSLRLRTRLFLIVLLGAVLPLAVAGYWLTRSAVRASEDVLLERLNEAVIDAADQVRNTWPRPRGALLTLVDDVAVQEELDRRLGGETRATAGAPASLVKAFEATDARIVTIVVRDAAGEMVWRLDRTPPLESGIQARQPPLTVELPIYHLASGRQLGTLRADTLMSVLLEEPPASIYAAGLLLAAFDPASGASLRPTPFESVLLTRNRFEWTGDEWLTSRLLVTEPAVELVVAAPLGPVAVPFERVARQGLFVLGLVVLVALALTAVLTGGVTRSVGRLTTAAEHVARGQLDQQVPESGTDEIARLGQAFNTMTTSLQRTLDELTERQALAAVGEFAASLSHDVRNALTSIRLDLQMLGETSDEAQASRLRERALRKIGRLNDTVTAALSLARSGRVERTRVRLIDPIAAAAEAARPEIERKRVSLTLPEADEIVVDADRAALEELFLNLLLNAAQAVPDGGSVNVDVSVDRDDARVTVRDTGPGIPPEIRERIFEPFVSNRAGGTGLGLAIVRRIARAHGGEVAIRSSSAEGTTIDVRLPLPETGG
jgi:signal transduction histidine kinase